MGHHLSDIDMVRWTKYSCNDANFIVTDGTGVVTKQTYVITSDEKLATMTTLH